MKLNFQGMKLNFHPLEIFVGELRGYLYCLSLIF